MTFASKIDPRKGATAIADPRTILRVGLVAAQAFGGQSALQPFIEVVLRATRSRSAGLVRIGAGHRPIVLAAMPGFDAALADHANVPVHAEATGRCLTFATRSARGAALILEQTDHTADVLVLANSESDLLAALGPELAEQWRNRSSLVAPQGEGDTGAPRPSRDILSSDNPYALTAAELRICTLLTQGMKPAQMAKTLNCAMPTIRTHLSSIYAKTELPGMVQVVCALTGGQHRGHA